MIDGVIFLHCDQATQHKKWLDHVADNLSNFKDVTTAMILNGRGRVTDWINLYVEDKIRIITPEKRWLETEDLPKYVKNWLVIGQTWQICCHDDPIGFNTLAKSSSNIYITPWSVYKGQNSEPWQELTQEDVDSDKLEWTTIDNFGWKLNNG